MKQLGIKQSDYSITPLETIEVPLWWQEQGLTYTATGYGRKIPTRYKVKHNNRLKRVYCCIISNIGTCYIVNGKDKIIVSEV